MTWTTVVLQLAVFVLAVDVGFVFGAWWAGTRRATLEAQAAGLTELRVMAEAECDAALGECAGLRRKYEQVHQENARLRREAPALRIVSRPTP